MRFVLDGRVLGGQAEGVPAHRMQHVEAAHALHASHDVANGVVAHVAHVHRAAGVREHFQDVVFWFGGVSFRFKHTFFGPTLLPLGLYFLRVVAARRSRTRCGLLRHAAYPLLRALFVALALFVPDFVLLATELLLLLERRRLSAEIFLFNAGVSIEKPFSASGA